MNSWKLLMADWTCPNPEDIFGVEIPDEIEAWENWELWRFDIDAIWPAEPDISNPPTEEGTMLGNFVQTHSTEENTSLAQMVQRWIREGWTGLEITGELELWQDHYRGMIEHSCTKGETIARDLPLWELASQLQDFISQHGLYGRQN